MCTYFAGQYVGFLEVAAEHLWRLAGNRLDFNAHLLALACALHLLVVALDGRHDADVEEL